MKNFITNIIETDLKNGLKEVVVRFPPEPNGYLHFGHAKSIILNSEIAKIYNGKLNLRFDDTNPEKENIEYVENIKKDAFWLVDNFNNIYYTSDYFDKIYDCAILLINKGLAYVDDSSVEQINMMRGDFLNKGINSPYRNREIKENLDLFIKMKNGFFKNNECVLRAKIDMENDNLNLRDPIIYRIKHAYHHNTKNKWCIYPMYDFAHPISDGIEGITHSLCTTEFEDHKPLYNWFIKNCKSLLIGEPKQIEFSKLEIENMILSKRKLLNLVNDNIVNGWTDPKMPTIAGLRNKGFTPDMLKDFVLKCGFTKNNTIISYDILEESVKNILNPIAKRTMAVINPVELIIDNYNVIEKILINNHPKKDLGFREVLFSSKIYIDRDDIRLKKEENFFRVYPGNWVRLKNAYNIFIKEIITDENSNPIKVIAELDSDSKIIKNAKNKAKIAIHWVSSLDCSKIKFINNNESKDILVNNDLLNNIGHYEFERVGYIYLNNNIAYLLATLKK